MVNRADCQRACGRTPAALRDYQAALEYAETSAKEQPMPLALVGTAVQTQLSEQAGMVRRAPASGHQGAAPLRHAGAQGEGRRGRRAGRNGHGGAKGVEE